MSISSLNYASKYGYVGSDGNVVNGYIDYILDRESTFDFLGSTKVPIKITQEMMLNDNVYNTATLQSFANGIKMVVSYRLINPSDRSNKVIFGTAYLQDKNGVTLPTTTYRLSDGNTLTLNGSLSFSITLTDASDVPIGTAIQEPIWYIPSRTGYGRDPVGGQPAQYVNVGGMLIVPRSYTDTSRVPLEGILDEDFLSDWSTSEVGQLSFSTDETLDCYYDWLNKHGDGTNIKPDPTEKDPSKEDGGGSTDYQSGTKGPHGDDVSIPSLPSTSAIQTGFISMYNPTTAQLRSLSSELWNPDFTEMISRLMKDPFDAIICLNMLPFAPTTSGSARIDIGNYQSNVIANVVSNQYKNISCGSVTIPENWRNFLDYDNTSAQIFLPFVGFKPLDINDVMNQTLTVEYNCDVLTGQAVCFVTTGGYCLYQFPCNVASQIPMSGSHYANMLQGILGLTGAGIGLGMSVASGNAVGVALSSALLSGAGSALNMGKQQVEHGGALNGCIGHLGGFTPYIVLHKPVQNLPNNYRNLKGYPSNIGGTLGSFSGYTEVAYAHLDGVTATDREKEEIDRLLKEGVIV